MNLPPAAVTPGPQTQAASHILNKSPMIPDTRGFEAYHAACHFGVSCNSCGFMPFYMRPVTILSQREKPDRYGLNAGRIPGRDKEHQLTIFCIETWDHRKKMCFSGTVRNT
jgi:hypothetical protein